MRKFITFIGKSVSIPHRQSGSLIGGCLILSSCVSIPHRQSGSKTPRTHQTPVQRFNSSQVVWKLRRFGKLQKSSPVSIPHRQSGSLDYLPNQQYTHCFNSSQVVWKQDQVIPSLQILKRFNSSQVVWKLVADSRRVQERRVSIPHRQSGSEPDLFL